MQLLFSTVRPLGVLVLAFLALTSTAYAQTTTARLNGTVQDQSGAVVPNAKVTATNIKTDISANAISNSDG